MKKLITTAFLLALTAAPVTAGIKYRNPKTDIKICNRSGYTLNNSNFRGRNNISFDNTLMIRTIKRFRSKRCTTLDTSGWSNSITFRFHNTKEITSFRVHKGSKYQLLHKNGEISLYFDY